MKTEEAVQTFWESSLIWKGRSEQATTVGKLFATLEPLTSHFSPLGHVQRQAQILSDEVVKMKRKRPGKQKRNVVAFPIPVVQKKAAVG